MRKWFLGLSALILLVGCESLTAHRDAGPDPENGGIAEVPNPSAEMARKSKTPLATLQKGHVTYMLNCGQCHYYKLPADIDVEDWQEVMPKMISHAGLEPGDEKAVLAYVLAVKATQEGKY
jgi:hypothetical protein